MIDAERIQDELTPAGRSLVAEMRETAHQLRQRAAALLEQYSEAIRSAAAESARQELIAKLGTTDVLAMAQALENYVQMVHQAAVNFAETDTRVARMFGG